MPALHTGHSCADNLNLNHIWVKSIINIYATPKEYDQLVKNYDLIPNEYNLSRENFHQGIDTIEDKNMNDQVLSDHERDFHTI